MLPRAAGWEGLVEAEELETLEVLLQRDAVVGVWEASSCLPLPSLLWAIEISLNWKGGKTSHLQCSSLQLEVLAAERGWAGKQWKGRGAGAGTLVIGPQRTAVWGLGTM